MDITTISLKKFQSIIMEAPTPLVAADEASATYALTLNAHLMSQGYVLSEALFDALKTAPSDLSVTLAETLLPAVKALKGSHVVHKPMYPNFPEQVIQASSAELYLNAIMHYYSEGEWLPSYNKLPRAFAFENVKFQVISMIDMATFCGLFSTLLSSRDSLSDEDKAIVEWFMAQDFAASLSMPSARVSPLLNAGLFQLGWFCCVLGGSIVALLATPLILAVHFRVIVPRYQRLRELRWLAGFLALGMVVDGSLALAGGYGSTEVPSEWQAWLPLPVWLWCLWPLFASTLHHALAWLWRHPWLAAACGAISAPLSYYSGAQLAGIALADWLLPVQAVIWGSLCLGIAYWKQRAA